MSKEIEKEIQQLYKKWPDIRAFLRSKGCDDELGEDFFQEALLIFMRKRKEGLQMEVEPFYYVKTTTHYLFLNHLKKQQRNPVYSLENDIASEEIDFLEKEAKLSSIEKALKMIGEKCQEVLKAFYVEKKSMDLIAEQFDLGNAKVAKAQKYRCIQKLKDQVQLIKQNT